MRQIGAYYAFVSWTLSSLWSWTSGITQLCVARSRLYFTAATGDASIAVLRARHAGSVTLDGHHRG